MVNSNSTGNLKVHIYRFSSYLPFKQQQQERPNISGLKGRIFSFDNLTFPGSLAKVLSSINLGIFEVKKGGSFLSSKEGDDTNITDKHLREFYRNVYMRIR